jgi:hypothetical protein
MKSRHSPNLYEILRSAAAPRDAAAKSDSGTAAAVAAAPPPPPPPSVIEETEPVVEAPPLPPPPPVYERERIVVTAPAPAPVVVERPEPVATPGLGERSVRITYNTMLFAGLVVVGAVFLSFTLGVRNGRKPADAPPATNDLQAASPQAPKVPSPKFTIRLIEYRARTSQEYTKALDAAIRYKNELERLGLREAVVETLGMTPDRRVVLRYGEYTDAAAGPARETLKKLQEMKLDKGAKEPTFARTAQFQTRQ